MAESNKKGSKDPAKGGGRVPPNIPPPPPVPQHSRIPPPPPAAPPQHSRIAPPPPAAPPLRFPPAPPRSYPPPPPPSDIPYVPLEQSATSEESVSEPTEQKKSAEGKPEEKPEEKSQGRPQGARRKMKSTVPVPPPLPKELPERPRVSMNPRGRDSPAPNSSSDYDVSPKRGFIRTFFSKAKDYMLKKGYLPLEQHDSEVYIPEMPEMLKKYTPLEDDAYRITPPRDIQKDSGALSKLLTKKLTSSAEVTSEPEPESELESSADNLGYVADEPEAAKGDVHPLEKSRSESDAVSDHGSIFSESEEYVVPTPIATAHYAEAAVETEVVKPISVCSANAAEVNSELYSIKVNSPADIKVAYTVSGSLTTCITYETEDSAKNTETEQKKKDKK